MNDKTDSGGDFLAGLALLGLLPILPILFVWFSTAFVAGLIAVSREHSFWGFFFATFFFLGPLGVGVALLATRGELDYAHVPPMRKVAEGRQRFICPRCGAESDISYTDTPYDCWCCGEHRKVKPKVSTGSKT
jgi:DNA-directed RNA polymerase subunit RPC12/RpoP